MTKQRNVGSESSSTSSSSSRRRKKDDARKCCSCWKGDVVTMAIIVLVSILTFNTFQNFRDIISHDFLTTFATSNMFPIIPERIMTTTTTTTQQNNNNNNNNTGGGGGGSSIMQYHHHSSSEPPPACRIVLENKMDYHYEIIESTVLQFPLPWEKLLHCNITNSTGTSTSSSDGRRKPVVIFDIALVEQKGRFDEKQGWLEYYHNHLEGTIQERKQKDGYQVMAQFGEIVRYTNYTKSYAAMIGVSCDSYNFHRWMRNNENTFCVLHGICDRCTPLELKRSCHLNPMHPNCYYLPTDFPHLPEWDNNNNTRRRQQRQRPKSNIVKKMINNDNNQNTSLNLCVSGSGRNYDLLAEGLASYYVDQHHPSSHNNNKIDNIDIDIRVKILSRSANVPTVFVKYNLTSLVDIIRTNKFLEFQKVISEQCDLLLPLLDPEHNPNYFFGDGDSSLKTLSGSLPQAIAYQLPTVMHTGLYDIYKDHLSAPSNTYNDSTSFHHALHNMIDSQLIAI